MGYNIEKIFCENFKKWVEKNHPKKQYKLAEKLNISAQQLNNLKHGRRVGDESWRRWAADQLGLDYDELIGIKKKTEIKNEKYPIIVDVIDGFEKINIEEHADHYRGIPLYESGKLAPGAGGYSFDEKPVSTMVVYQPEIQDRIKHDLRALRVKGDSMWPRMPEGAIVIVDLNDRKFVDRQIYVVRDPNSEPPTATVRRICKADQKHFKGLALVSENPEYLPEMTDLDWHELIVGRAVWMWRNLENA